MAVDDRRACPSRTLQDGVDYIPTPAFPLLAQQAEVLSPDHKETTLSLVTGVGAAVS